MPTTGWQWARQRGCSVDAGGKRCKGGRRMSLRPPSSETLTVTQPTGRRSGGGSAGLRSHVVSVHGTDDARVASTPRAGEHRLNFRTGARPRRSAVRVACRYRANSLLIPLSREERDRREPPSSVQPDRSFRKRSSCAAFSFRCSWLWMRTCCEGVERRACIDRPSASSAVSASMPLMPSPGRIGVHQQLLPGVRLLR